MTLREAHSELLKYSYKPGWTLEVEGHDDRYFKIVVAAIGQDVNPPHAHGPIKTERRVSIDILEMDGAKYFHYLVKAALWEVEAHEFNEWFKYEGKCVTDPHPERVNATSGT